MDSAEECFRLRQQLREEDGDFEEPKIENSSVSFGDLKLVGHGKVTSDRCGTWSSVLLACHRVELHNRIKYAKLKVGKEEKVARVTGKKYYRKILYSCDKPSCPICKHQWAVRQAFKMEARLKEASKKFGQVEHLTVSVAPKDYGLSYRAVLDKIAEVLYRCNIIGGCSLPHSLRFDDERWVWYLGPHLHILGFVAGGYGRCRRCKGGDCYACDGIQGKLYKEYRRSGYIVRIFDERKTVGGTCVYELEHATMDYSKKRPHVVTWFGVCSYRKFKFTPEQRKALCPICKNELVRSWWVGKEKLSDLGKNGLADGESLVEVVEKQYGGSGSYEE